MLADDRYWGKADVRPSQLPESANENAGHDRHGHGSPWTASHRTFTSSPFGFSIKADPRSAHHFFANIFGAAELTAAFVCLGASSGRRALSGRGSKVDRQDRG
jgi:hypothetical protein